MALQLARNSKAPCEIILVGRNKAKADSIIDLMKTQASTEHRYSFRSCDVTSFANVRKLCAGIKADHDKVNLLFMTCGFVSMGVRPFPFQASQWSVTRADALLQGRKENNDVEKTDTKMAAHFYSRNLIVKELLPLLEKAQQATGDARVISVLDPAWGPGKLDYDDLELKNTFGLGKCAKHTTTMTNVILEVRFLPSFRSQRKADPVYRTLPLERHRSRSSTPTQLGSTPASATACPYPSGSSARRSSASSRPTRTSMLAGPPRRCSTRGTGRASGGSTRMGSRSPSPWRRRGRKRGARCGSTLKR